MIPIKALTTKVTEAVIFTEVETFIPDTIIKPPTIRTTSKGYIGMLTFTRNRITFDRNDSKATFIKKATGDLLILTKI